MHQVKMILGQDQALIRRTFFAQIGNKGIHNSRITDRRQMSMKMPI